MKNITLKKMGIAISVACMGMAAGVAQAAALNTFTNGTAADADEVNHNFTYLDARIDTHSLTPGPAGADGTNGIDGATGINGANGIDGANGINGANGIDGVNGIDGANGINGTNGIDGTNGADGVGVTFQSWAGFGGAVKWNIKVFDVVHSAGSWDKETRTLVRSNLAGTTGTTTMTRQRTHTTNGIIKHQVLTFNYDTAGDSTLDEMKSYNTGTLALVNTKTISPGFITRHNAMGIGMNWATASTITQVDNTGGGAPDVVNFGTESRSLLAVEDVTTTKGGTYTGCLKILTQRNAQAMGGVYQAVTWHCPNDGMVKRIVSKETVSWMMEFDPTNSTLQP